jgi:hypothetical protein
MRRKLIYLAREKLVTSFGENSDYFKCLEEKNFCRMMREAMSPQALAALRSSTTTANKIAHKKNFSEDDLFWMQQAVNSQQTNQQGFLDLYKYVFDVDAAFV